MLAVSVDVAFRSSSLVASTAAPELKPEAFLYMNRSFWFGFRVEIR